MYEKEPEIKQVEPDPYHELQLTRECAFIILALNEVTESQPMVPEFDILVEFRHMSRAGPLGPVEEDFFHKAMDECVSAGYVKRTRPSRYGSFKYDLTDKARKNMKTFREMAEP